MWTKDWLKILKTQDFICKEKASSFLCGRQLLYDICISYIAFNKMYVWRTRRMKNTSFVTTLTIYVLYIKKQYEVIIWVSSSSYTTRPLEVLLLSGSQREDLRLVCEMRGWNAAAGADLCSVAVWIIERWIVALQSHSTCSSGSIRSWVVEFHLSEGEFDFF